MRCSVLALAIAACSGARSAPRPAPTPTPVAPDAGADAGADAGVVAVAPAEPARPLLITFGAGTAQLQRASEPGLTAIKTYLDENPSVTRLRIESHFFFFEPEPGMVLTAQRAMVVARWLIAHGIDCKRLRPVGFGATGTPPPPPEDAAYVAVVAVEVGGRPVAGRFADNGGRYAGDPCR
jgi:OOP family OmpA-OmpF porin